MNIVNCNVSFAVIIPCATGPLGWFYNITDTTQLQSEVDK